MLEHSYSMREPAQDKRKWFVRWYHRVVAICTFPKHIEREIARWPSKFVPVFGYVFRFNLTRMSAFLLLSGTSLSFFYLYHVTEVRTVVSYATDRCILYTCRRKRVTVDVLVITKVMVELFVQLRLSIRENMNSQRQLFDIGRDKNG